MKFDFIMEKLYKILCILVCCVLVVACVASCFHPVKASAVDISGDTQINEYFNASAQNLQNLDFEWNSDQDGNRSVKLKIYGLQKAALENQSSFYNSFDLSTAPASGSVSGSSASGLYRSRLDNDVHSVVYCPGSASADFGVTVSAPMYSSDEFTIMLSAEPYSTTRLNVSGSVSDGRYGLSIAGTSQPGYSAGWYPSLTGGTYFNAKSWTSRYNFLGFQFSANAAIPLLGIDFLSGAIGYNLIGTSAQYFTLPDGDYDIEKPWEYYDDTLLPYLYEQFPDFTDLFIFPDGYYPTIDPVEPDYQAPVIIGGGAAGFVFAPVIMGDGVSIDLGGLNFDIFAPIDDFLRIDGLDFSFPIDNNIDSIIKINGITYPVPFENPVTIDGREVNFTDINHFSIDGVNFVRNSDGTITINNDTTVNLPIGEPTTLASDANTFVYQYEIPTNENLNIVDATLQTPDLSAYASNISTFWAFVEKVYNGSGLMPILIICLSLSAVGYGLWKIAG